MDELLIYACHALGCVRVWQIDGKYLAACQPVYRDQHKHERTTWNHHDTPSQAIEALLAECGVTKFQLSE